MKVLAAAICDDLARGYRPSVSIARANHCRPCDVDTVRHLFGDDRATLLRAAALLREPEPKPKPEPKQEPKQCRPRETDADPALLADVRDSTDRIDQAKTDRNAALHHRPDHPRRIRMTVTEEDRSGVLVAENNRLRGIVDRRNATIDTLSEELGDAKEALLRAGISTPRPAPTISPQRRQALAETIHILAVELGASRRKS